MTVTGEPVALYKCKPGSKKKQVNPNISITALLDTMEGLSEIPGLKLTEAPRVDRSTENPTLALPSFAFLPFEAGDKLLDVPTLMNKTRDLA